MKIGIVIPVYNRPAYLKRCLDSLMDAEFPRGTAIQFIDDGCNQITSSLIDSFNVDGVLKAKLTNASNIGVKKSLERGYDFMFSIGCDAVINLDSDAIVRRDFINVLCELHNLYPDRVITGFHSTTKNKDGSERHKIISRIITSDCFAVEKESVGGINMMMNLRTYIKYMKPVLNEPGNWDHRLSIRMMKDNLPIICAVPSVVEHIGFESSMGHDEQPDIAEGFKPLALPNVTIIGIDCVDVNRLKKAIEHSCENILFGGVKLLTSLETDYEHAVKIKRIGSKQEYSEFMINDLINYIDTDFALIVQYDGYVLNYRAWDEYFLKYDYIGACWWYTDGMNVGNGGFSLRSKKLIKAVAQEKIKRTHPEDDVICRQKRKELELKYNLKFAPEEVASRFSIENHNRPKDHLYTGQFGFHGTHIKTTNSGSYEKKNNYIINQFRGLGDILFLMPLANHWIRQGKKIIWPVVKEYLDIQKHFPQITFIDKESLKIDYESRDFIRYEEGLVIPMRWAEAILKAPYKDCMRSKYDLLNADFNMWRELSWLRDKEKEDELFYDILKLGDRQEYHLFNQTFRTDKTGHYRLPGIYLQDVVELRTIDGFTLLDWGKVIEKAKSIHTVGTSINYMLEVMDLKAESIHLYVRRPEEKDFSYYDYLLKKRYIFHY
jgi:glycosyltransferase involved in cell wall biosynthesis